MTTRVKITHDEPESTQKLAVTLVEVGKLDDNGQKQVLAPGESCTVDVRSGQFLMVDETDSQGD